MWALNTGKISGAGLDVLAEKPPKKTSPLLGNVKNLKTPHVAWSTREARLRLVDITIENIKAFKAGQSENTIA